MLGTILVARNEGTAPRVPRARYRAARRTPSVCSGTNSKLSGTTFCNVIEFEGA